MSIASYMTVAVPATGAALIVWEVWRWVRPREDFEPFDVPVEDGAIPNRLAAVRCAAMSDTLTCRTPPVLAGEYARACLKRDEGGTEFCRNYDGGVADALAWVMSGFGPAPLSRAVREADPTAIRLELLAAREDEHEARGRPGEGDRASGVARALNWCLDERAENPA